MASYIIKCDVCDELFNTSRKHANTCSVTCRSRLHSRRHRNKPIYKQCENCGYDFVCSGLSNSKKYCCVKCKNKSRYNREFNSIERLKKNLRSRLYDYVKGQNKKVGSAVRDLGCSIEHLKEHLEAQFEPGMSWDNYGRDGWHIDHIKPLSSFDLNDVKQLKKACHYTNLQPLWQAQNLRKGCSYE